MSRTCPAAAWQLKGLHGYLHNASSSLKSDCLLSFGDSSLAYKKLHPKTTVFGYRFVDFEPALLLCLNITNSSLCWSLSFLLMLRFEYRLYVCHSLNFLLARPRQTISRTLSAWYSYVAWYGTTQP